MPRPINDEEAARKMQEVLSKIREQEEEHKTAAFKNKYAQERHIARQTELDKLQQKQFTKNPKGGEKVTLWDEGASKAYDAINMDVMSYTDWRAAMMNLLKMFSVSNKAIHSSLAINVIHPVKTLLLDQAAVAAYYWVADKLTGDPEIDLPALQQQVQFSDDNKLVIKPLIRLDNEDNKVVNSQFLVNFLKR